MNTQRSFVLAFDTANEVIAIGLGKLDAATQSIECVASVEVEARRASNTQLLPRVDELCAQAGVGRGEIACVAVGRGPGSFTGVRIALACAAGLAVIYLVGLPYMGLILNVYLGKDMGVAAILWAGMLPFLPWDVVKIAATVVLAGVLVPRMKEMK